jgi:hypothetical protein
MSNEKTFNNIVVAARKYFAIADGAELKSTPSVSDVVHLPGLKIRTDELPKVIVFGIAQMYRIDRKTMEGHSAFLLGDTKQQNTYALKQYERKWNALVDNARNNEMPGVRRAIVALCMVLRRMEKSSWLKVEYNG